MYTKCSACEAVLPINAKNICAASGKVRCGRCGAVFVATDALTDALNASGKFPPVFRSERPPTLRDDSCPDPEDDLFLGNEEAAIDFSILGDVEAPTDPNIPPPIAQYQPRRRWPWALGTFGMAIALVAQWAWYEREYLLAHPTFGPWAEKACQQLQCTDQESMDLSVIRLVDRNIRPHPSVAGALMISATMQNTAKQPTPFPLVDITLSNLDGDITAARRFAPAEYLEDETQLLAGMEPETLVPLVFEVVDPGDQSVAFEFTFRDPNLLDQARP